jgi:hypothetical protein
MKISGWKRLWIFVSGIYLFLVTAIAVVGFPSAGSIPHSQALFNSLPPELLKQILGNEKSGIITTDFVPVKKVEIQYGAWTKNNKIAFKQEIQNKDLLHQVKMPNGHVLLFRSGISKQEIENIARQYWTIAKKLAKKQQAKYIGLAFAWWIIPVSVIYALGWSVGWVCRGFRKQT